MAWPLITVGGSPHEQGLAHGRLLAPLIAQNLTLYFARFQGEAGLSREEALALARPYAQMLPNAHPAYHEGLEGIATGADLPLADIIALNVRYEILYTAHTNLLLADGCTAAALLPAATKDGRLLIGQNWDWIPAVNGAIVRTEPEEGPATLAFTEAGIFGGKIGFNAAGVALCVNGMLSTKDGHSPGTPFHVRCRDILRSPTLAEATAAATKGKRPATANFLIAHAPDGIADVEAAPTDCRVIPPQDSILAHANHFADPHEIEATEPPNPRRRLSCQRQERLNALLRSNRPVSAASFASHLQDHLNDPYCLCRHGNEPDLPPERQMSTVTSIVMDPTQGTLQATQGPPCQSAATLYTLAP